MADKRSGASQSHLTREQVRLKLEAAGLLAELPDALEKLSPLSGAERARIGALFAGSPPSEELLDEDRGVY